MSIELRDKDDEICQTKNALRNKDDEIRGYELELRKAAKKEEAAKKIIGELDIWKRLEYTNNLLEFNLDPLPENSQSIDWKAKLEETKWDQFRENSQSKNIIEKFKF